MLDRRKLESIRLNTLDENANNRIFIIARDDIDLDAYIKETTPAMFIEHVAVMPILRIRKRYVLSSGYGHVDEDKYNKRYSKEKIDNFSFGIRNM